ncbi:MAG: Zn-ribbon domain-containing protein [Petrotogales bacterium]
MPHQCLKCGRVFEEGSSQLLKGCPDCGGNRFFFTKQPLDEKERDIISTEANKDIPSKIIETLVEKNKGAFDKSEKWVTIKPKEVRSIIKGKIVENVKETEKQEPIQPIDDEQRKAIIEKIKSEVDEVNSPETIGIEKPGKYNIDLKGLLEEEPIIIQKDGSYTIHLPSVFKISDKKKK